MKPEQVDKMLEAYNQCRSRITHIRNQLEIMERHLASEKAHAIENDAIHAVNYDGMPHGTTVGNPTESLVLRYLSGYQPRYIKDLQEDVDKARDELFEAQMVVSFVDGWLICLTDRERFIIERHVIQGDTWRAVLDQYEERFGQFGREGLKKLRKKAMFKIYEAAA